MPNKIPLENPTHRYVLFTWPAYDEQRSWKAQTIVGFLAASHSDDRRKSVRQRNSRGQRIARLRLFDKHGFIYA